MRRLPVLSVSLGLMLASATAAHAQVLYAAAGGTIGNSPLYILNQSTAAATTVGNIGYGISALAVNPLNGVLYGATAPGGSGIRNLITINQSTGVGTIVGNIGLGNFGIADMAFRSDGTLFCWSENSDALATINTTTGAGTLVGSDPGISTRGSGLDFSSIGVLWLAGNNANGPLRIVNTTTGQTTTAATLSNGPLPGDPIPAMKFHPITGQMFAVNRQVGPTNAANVRLITIDPASGVITTIGTPPPGIDGLAFSVVGVPTMPQMWYVGLAAAVLLLVALAVRYMPRANDATA